MTRDATNVYVGSSKRVGTLADLTEFLSHDYERVSQIFCVDQDLARGERTDAFLALPNQGVVLHYAAMTSGLRSDNNKKLIQIDAYGLKEACQVVRQHIHDRIYSPSKKKKR